ncbi:PorT family protein [Lacihabitans sp. LS3-19]|uniref:outer membrane beta-barrel protein n=1 Tax=Lacihabitans sp. LS3-19 TaxID=2487335 RepID=UPI0020CFB812|nr:outer membrane beta-barrel protein [Lacihabitans sp. LS3-19]MCP9770041.1 PorT family protein [Lacihabitans sp. LS3-19]
MPKVLFSFFLFLSLSSLGQIILPDSANMPIDTSLKAKEVFFDTLSYSEEYRRDVWRFTYGVRGGVSRGKYIISENTIDRVGSNGLPIIGQDGKIVKNKFVNNATFNTGYSAGVFGRFIRGAFYIQPELIYSAKAGKFDILKTDGSLYKRVNGKFSSIDVPLLVGIRSNKARVFFGPTFNFAYKLNSEMKDALGEFVDNQKLNHKFFNRPIMNFNVGLGFEFKAFFIDVRYEKGIKSYTLQTLGPSNSPKVFDMKADAFHIGIGFIHK